MIRVVESFSSVERLAFAHEFIGNFAAGTEILLVGASRDAVDGLARSVRCHACVDFRLASL